MFDEGSGYLALKAVMMPRDTNPYGTIFGGVLLSYIDQAGAVGARWEILQRFQEEPVLVTVAMDKVEFHEPVFVGDTVSFVTRISRVGNSSVTVQVSVTTERNQQEVRLTEAQVTYVRVAMDGSVRKPMSIRSDS